MSYTEPDVIENIFQEIKSDFGIKNVIDVLIRWYEKEKSHYEINGWDTKSLNKKIKILKSKRKGRD